VLPFPRWSPAHSPLREDEPVAVAADGRDGAIGRDASNPRVVAVDEVDVAIRSHRDALAGTAHLRIGVLHRHEVDAESTHLVAEHDQVTDASRESIELPDRQDVEPALFGRP